MGQKGVAVRRRLTVVDEDGVRHLIGAVDQGDAQYIGIICGRAMPKARSQDAMYTGVDEDSNEPVTCVACMAGSDEAVRLEEALRASLSLSKVRNG